MARVLVLTTAEKGHLNPMVGTAQWLMRLGHQVAWLCLPEPAPQLDSLGVEVLRLPAASHPPLVTQGPELARLVRDGPALRSWIKTLLLDMVPDQIPPLREILRGHRPDVVALDPMLYQGVIAAHLEEIPYAGLSSSLNPVTPDDLDSELLRTVRDLAPARTELFARHGMAPEFRVCDCLSPHLNVVFTTESYVGFHNVPGRTVLAGPTIPPEPRGDEVPFPWERIDQDRPLLYVSFGSQIWWQPELFAKVIEAARPLDVQVVCSAGELASELPADVVAVPYAPQLAILSRARAFVTHGGANSVMEALWSGVPLLVSPVCNDQPHQAWFAERAGVGRRVDLLSAGVEQCREALKALLAPEGPHRDAVRRVRDSYRARDGAREAAGRVAALAG